jgi:hypothetical protein
VTYYIAYPKHPGKPHCSRNLAKLKNPQKAQIQAVSGFFKVLCCFRSLENQWGVEELHPWNSDK